MTIASNSSLVGRRFYCLLGILGLLSCLSFRALPGSQASAAQSGGVTLRVDVELVTVEVMVLDKKGHPVRNLGRDSFQLHEDGKKQEIVTFAEISDDPSRDVPTSLADVEESGLPRGKVVLILFDDSHITPSQLHLARESAEKYVKEQMRPVDLFAVVTYGRSLKVLQNFTHDAAKVVEAVRQPATSYANPARDMTGAALPGMQSGRGGAPRATPRPPGEVSEARYRAAELFRSLNALNSSIGPVRGKKVVLMYSEDFSASVDVQTDYMATVDSAKKSNVAFYTIDVRGLNTGPIGEMFQHPADTAKSSLYETARNSPSRAKSLFERLAAGGPLGSGGLQSLGITSMFQQGGGGQTGGSGGSRTGGGTSSGSTPPGGTGGGAQPPGGTGSRTTTPGTTSPTTSTTSTNRGDGLNRGDNPDFSQFAQQRMDNMLRSLSSATGGVPVFNTGDFNGRLNDLTQGLNNYYVLGFQSNNPKRDGKMRRLEVKTDLKGVELKHREGYLDPRPLDVLAGSKGEKSMLSAIASPSMAVQLPVAFRASYFYDSPGLARIPIAATIRLASVALKNKSGQLAGDMNVMGVAYGEDGNIAARFSETLHLNSDKDKEEQFRKQNYFYRNHFKLRPGKYQLKLAIADEKGKVGSAEQSIAVPPMAQNELAGSTLIVAAGVSRLPALIQDLQVKLLEENDPLIYRGYSIIPSIENLLPANKPVNLIFKVYNLSGNAEPRKLVAQAQLTNEKGESQSLPPISLDEYLYSTGRTEGVVGINLPFINVIPGKYRLVVATTEGISNRSLKFETDLQFQ